MGGGQLVALAILRDRHNGWSFGLRIDDFQFHGDDLKRWDREWLSVSLEITTPERSWRWADPALRFPEAKNLSKWFSAVAAGEAAPKTVDFVEPVIAFELIAETEDTVTVRIHLHPHDRPMRNQEFRQNLHQSALPMSNPPSPDWMRKTLYRDFTTTRDELQMAAQSLLYDLRQLPTREGLSL